MKALGFTKLLLLSAFIFVLHWVEESRGFVSWFNARVTPDITDATFWTFNLSGTLLSRLL